MPEFFDLPKGYGKAPAAAPRSGLDTLMDYLPGFRSYQQEAKRRAGQPLMTNVGEALQGSLEKGAWLLPGPAGKAATVGAAKMGLPALATRLAAPAGRIAAGGAIGGAESALKGESVPMGTAMGAAGAGVAEGAAKGLEVAFQQLLAPAIKKGAQAVFERGQEAAKGAWEASQAARQQTWDVAQDMVRRTKVSQIAQRMGQLLPELDVFKGDFFSMARSGEGKAAIDRVFDSAKNEIAKRIGGGTAKWLKIPALADERMSLDEAMQALTMQGGRMGKAGALDRSSSQSMGALDYGKARDQMVSELNRLDFSHEAGRIFDDAMKARSAARAYMTLVSKSMDDAGALDPRKLEINFNKIAGVLERKLGPYYDEAEKILLGGKRAPAPVGPKPKAPRPEPFPAGKFEPRGRIETLFQGPQVPSVSLGGTQVPTRLPEGVKAAGAAAGALNPAYALGLGEIAAQSARNINPFARRRSESELLREE